MISKKSITSTAWTALTAAGASGSCWIKINPEAGYVSIYHSSGSMSAVVADDGYSLFPANENNELLKISADSGTDIYYARCSNADATAQLMVDAI